jgi:hypothetical protein
MRRRIFSRVMLLDIPWKTRVNVRIVHRQRNTKLGRQQTFQRVERVEDTFPQLPLFSQTKGPNESIWTSMETCFEGYLWDDKRERESTIEPNRRDQPPPHVLTRQQPSYVHRRSRFSQPEQADLYR